MAKYQQLSIGASGPEVEKMQQGLIGLGYDLGPSGADGQFGPATDKAMRQYQADNGLTVDGIAGDMTLGKLYGGTSSNSSSTKKSSTKKTPTVKTYSTDAYSNAMNVLNEAQKNKPVYDSRFEGQIMDTYNQIVGRDKFSYDLNKDALYQQYKDQYAMLGQQAMMDTMGQAAGLTGGYGSSYSQAAGQQAYQGYLQRLNDIVPDLYNAAYNRYMDEGNQLYQQYSMLNDMENRDYNRFRDDTNDYYTDLGLARDDFNRLDSRVYDEMKASADIAAQGGDFSMYEMLYGPQAAAAAKKSYDDSRRATVSNSSPGTGGDPVPGGDPGTEIPAFTDRTKAVDYLISKGVSSASAGGIMTKSEWSSRKASNNKYGNGGAAVKNYDSYEDYLNDIVEYKLTQK